MIQYYHFIDENTSPICLTNPFLIDGIIVTNPKNEDFINLGYNPMELVENELPMYDYKKECLVVKYSVIDDIIYKNYIISNTPELIIT